jgi:hypothetical protein
MKHKLPVLRTDDLVVKELPNEVLIYDLENNKAYCLNETARAVMQECDGKKTADDAVSVLNARLKTPVNEEMVWLAIDQLKKAGMVADDYILPVQTSRVSRRKMLQSAAALGLALPMVTALVAPTSIHAQSNCVGQNQPCISTAGPECCPGSACFNTETGPTGFQCVGCIALGQPCTIGGTACCSGSCFDTETGPTGFQCFQLL